MKQENKVLIIGLDGADWRVLDQFIERDWMPNLQGLIHHGVKGTLRSTIPTQSATAWTSFMTGKNPGKHGIYDFGIRQRTNGKIVFNDFRSIRAETFFEIISKKGGKVGIIGMPMTYPPASVNGFLIAGMFTPNPKANYTYPASLRENINRTLNGFPMNVIRWNFLEGEENRLIEEAIIYTKQRVKVTKYLITTKPWNLFVFVFTSLDRLQHALLHIFDQTHPLFNKKTYKKYEGKIKEYVTLLDTSIGELAKSAGSGSTVFIMSDHGFQWVTHYFDTNQFLEDSGFLKFNKGSSFKNLASRTKFFYKEYQARYHNTGIDDFVLRKKANPIKILFKIFKKGFNPGNRIDWLRTMTYAHTSQGVSINLKCREKNGIVSENEKSELLEQIRNSLFNLSHPLTGTPIIEDAFLKEDILSGDYIDEAPDILFPPLKGVSKRGNMQNFQRLPWKTGDHSLDGILVAIGPDIRKNYQIKQTSIMDLAPTILHTIGYEIPSDMDGTVIFEIFREEWLKSNPPKITTGTKQDYEGTDLDKQEQEAIKNQLKGLGYL